MSKTGDMLSKLLTESRLRTLAGGRAFGRGADYFESGAVTDLIDGGDTIKARVEGTYEYEVSLRPERKTLGYDCTCPVGEAGDFCKHAVAVGLAWLAQHAGDGDVSEAYTGSDEIAALRRYLQGEDKAVLVDLIMEQIENDSGLRSRLQMKAIRRNQGVDIEALRKIVRKAMSVRGFVDYHGMRRYLARVYPLVDLISGLREDGHAEAAVQLSEYALRRGLSAYAKTDDSGGGFGDVLRQLSALHLEACRAACPESKALAKSLFQLQRDDHWGLVELDDYAPLLNDDGFKVYRALAEKEWQKVPVRGPGEDDVRAYAEHFNITRIMETLAERDGGLDALVAVKSRDLSKPYCFLEIAQLHAQAGRDDEALAWAERGRKSFPDTLDVRLVEFLAEQYHCRQRHDDALALLWSHFTQHPGLEAYRRLKAGADQTGAWARWREQALTWIRDNFIKHRSRQRAHRWHWMPGGHSLLVEIYLWEGNVAAALHEARTGGCAENLWLKLAAACEAGHPEDAIEIYQARIEPTIKLTNNDAYDRATELLQKVQTLTHRTGQQAEFDAYMEKLRIQYKQKRNFIKRLDCFTEEIL